MRKKLGVIWILGFLFFSFNSLIFSWTPPSRLTYNLSQSLQPKIALDSNDHIHVVWRDILGLNGELYYKKSTDGGTSWSLLKRLTWNPGLINALSIAIDPADVIHVVWGDNSPGNYEIYYKQSTDGGLTWSPPARLSFTAGTSDAPHLATDLGTNIFLVWADDSFGMDELLFKSSTNSGMNWSPPNRLTWNPTRSWSPKICVDSVGNIHLIYGEEMPPFSEIYYRNSTDGGMTWSPPNRITWNPGLSRFPCIQTDVNNNINIAWEDNSMGGNYEILYRRSTDGGITWSALSRLTWNPTDSYEAVLAVESVSNIHIVWVNLLATGFGDLYYKSTSNSGVSWSPTTRLTFTTFDSYYVDLDLSTINKPHVVWSDENPGNAEIYFKRKK